MNGLTRLLEKHFNTLFLICLAWVAGNVAVALWLRGKKPKISRQDVIYAERWQSGRSFRSLLTRFGGARNCLNIMFLKDRLIIKPHFPFDLFGAKVLGLEQTIPYHAVISCNIEDFFFGLKQVVLTYRNESGQQEKIAFTARDPQRVELLCRQRT